MSLIALTYGISALTTCVYLWRMRPQMRTAMTCWAASVAALGIYLSITMPAGPTELLAELAVFFPLALLVIAMWLYVARLSRLAAL